MNKAIHQNTLVPLGMVGVTILSGAFLLSTKTHADDVVDLVNITVPVSCTMSGTGMDTHDAEIENGRYVSDIGTTTLHAFCNDAEGFAIYANGYTSNTLGNNTLTNTTLGSTYDIITGTATSAGAEDVSNWAMKLAITQDSGDTTGTNAFTIDSDTEGSFGSYHTVPNEYTKVAHKESATDMAASTGGVKLTTTYAAYISKNQPAGTYSGQVKYVLVHPATDVPLIDGKLNIIYDANGLSFANGNTTNLVAYDATGGDIAGETKKIYYTGSYNSQGGFNSYGTPSGNNVITIDGAKNLHITVTYGAPPNNGGPASDLSIWQGNHPDYTDANNDTSLTNCGEHYSTNGAFSSTGSPSTQVTMDCYIEGDSVTFYDYSVATNNNASMGYYVEVVGSAYEKNEVSGAYAEPLTAPGNNAFLGWSTNPNANLEGEYPQYTNEADVIYGSSYLNEDNMIKLYAIWGKSFNSAFSDAGKMLLNDYYAMQDATGEICNSIFLGATETLIDSRDNNTYMVGRLKDGKCWLLDNLRLNPTIQTVAQGLNSTNTNASNEAIYNLIYHSSEHADGWTSVPISNVSTSFSSYNSASINAQSQDKKVNSFGLAAVNGQAKVGIYYNFCAASAGTYCYNNATTTIDIPDTLIDAPQDLCPANWRIPTGGPGGEYYTLAHSYDPSLDGSYSSNNALSVNSIQYNLSTPLSGYYFGASPLEQNENGSFWSSTKCSNHQMYQLFVYHDDYVYFDGTTSVGSGKNIRCLIK